MGSAIKFTNQQQAIFACDDRRMVVKAGAGSGKTTTLVGYSDLRKDLRTLYVAFNSGIVAQGEGRFGSHVVMKTAHSVAYGPIVMRNGLEVKDVDLTEVVTTFGADYPIAYLSKIMLSRWCNSSTRKFADFASEQIKRSQMPMESESALELAERMWAQMLAKARPVTHDAYLKMFQLSNPKLAFKKILFDEGQDASPVMLDIVLNQDADIIIVGDENQQIYSWRGAVNALAGLCDKATVLELNESFRFGPEIAQMANQILAHKGTSFRVIGRGQPGMLAGSPSGPHTILTRTNGGALIRAHEAISAGKKSVALFGGLKNYRTDLIRQIARLASGEKVSNALISKFESIEKLKEFADETEDVELSSCVAVVKTLGKKTESKLDALEGSLVSQKDATVLVSTAHRSKGLEWNTVEVHNDFSPVQDLLKADTYENYMRATEELNLLYVVSTRAMKVLVPNPLMVQLMSMDPGLGLQKPILQASNRGTQLLAAGEPSLLSAPLRKKISKLSKEFGLSEEDFISLAVDKLADALRSPADTDDVPIRRRRA